MSAKHTPGPWMITRGAQGDAFSIEGPTRTVAHVKTVREAEANAHLIAAAPDLLDALRSVVTPRAGGSWTNLTGENAQKALAAIAKAEGGQS